MPTGVDRVELAYLTHLVRTEVALFAIVRTTLGYILLGPDGVCEIRQRLQGMVPWGAVDTLSLSARRKGLPVQKAESDLRRFALDKCRPYRLSRMLNRHLPNGVSYLNVGHSNLTERMFQALRSVPEAQISILIHDVIPIEYPQFQRPGTPERFEKMLKRVRARSDLIIYNTQDTQLRTEAVMRNWGTVPDGIVAHLGIDLATPGPVPRDLVPDGPYFISVGTIEPRKGHDILLDVWEKLPPDAPHLLICGNRGWNNKSVFDRLDNLPTDTRVREINGLDDAALSGLISGAKALLFPSRAEGYGLPPVEAATLGVPVISSDLPAVREILKDIPVYVKETDCYQWLHSIENLTSGPISAVSSKSFDPPGWAAHFSAVLALC